MEVKEGYKQTEVGVIPNDWEVKKLGDVADITKLAGFEYTNYFNSYNDGGDIIVVRGTNITNNDLDLSDVRTIPRSTSNKLPRSKLHKDDLVFAYVGTIGPVYLIEEDDKYHLGPNTCKISVKENMNPRFAFCYFTSRLIKKEIIEFTSIGAQPSLSMSKIRKFKIILPPTKAEQTTIANALSDADALISNLEKLIAKKRNIKEGVMQELLTGNKRLPGFSGKWQKLNMADNSVLKARIGWQGLTTAEYLKSGDYYLVTGTDFLDGRVNWSSCCFVDENRYMQDKNIQLKVGDILLTKDGTIGKVGYVDTLPGPATLNSGVFVIRPKNNAYDPLFFYYILMSSIFNNFLVKLQAGSTISHLYQKDFVSFSFSTPKIEEQTAIAQVLSDMDTEIEALEQKLAKYRLLKQGMMQELLTGKTRLV